MLDIIETSFQGVYYIKSNSFVDDRGAYMRLFCDKELSPILNGKHFVNANYQKTNKAGTIRGLHYQTGEYCESKLIKCLKGEIFDVIIDIRKNSPTFMKIFSTKLDDTSDYLLFVPEGFAHGFQTLDDATETIYFTTEYYHPECEGGFNPLDPSLNIAWPIKNYTLSDKDRNRPYIENERKHE